MELSIVIPAKDEEKSLPILYQEIIKAVKPLKKDFEVIVIDDGSEDQTSAVVLKISQKDPRVKLIKFRGNLGKSAALSAGFAKAKGKVIITLDADLQDNPSEIPKMLKTLDQGYDLVCGWKKKRHDPMGKVFPSRIYNKMTAFLSGVKLHDFNCGFKAYRQEVAKSLVLYGELYRLIPILAAEKKFKIIEAAVNHRPRQFGQSKFGSGRFLKGFLDMITVIYLARFTRRPAHFFGSLGIVLFSIGFLTDLYVALIKLTTGTTQGRTPLLLAGILLMVIGVQLFSTGLLAEMITFYNQKQRLGQE